MDRDEGKMGKKWMVVQAPHSDYNSHVINESETRHKT